MPEIQKTPHLDAPGAGLPLLQSLFLRYYMGPFVAKKSNWEDSQKNFDRIHSKILKAIEGLSEARLKHRVLVRPLPGIEDSSRMWSVLMALEHIMIVGEGVGQIIINLSQNKKPNLKVSTADVKPLGTMSSELILKNFKKYVETTMPNLDKSMGDKNSKLTLKHPWFGEFNAKQWYWLLGAHGVIHYNQIKEIKKGLDLIK